MQNIITGQLPILSLLIWFPIISAGILLLVTNKIAGIYLQWLAIFCSFICLLLTIVLWYKFDIFIGQYQAIEYINWLPKIGIKYALGVDGISLLFIVLSCLMSFLVLLFALQEQRAHLVQYYTAFLLIQGLLCGVFSAIDALLFYGFFEALLIPMFLIIGIWGDAAKIYASIKFFLFTVIGSIPLLLGLIYLLTKTNQAILPEPIYTLVSFQSLVLTMTEQRWLFWGLLVAFAIKLPLVPLHTWLPTAHAEAPTGGSVILAAIMLKIAGYGMLRLLLPIVPQACVEFAPIMWMAAIIAIIYIGFITIVQKDLKKLIAYSSIAHMSLVILGLFSVFALLKSAKTIDEVTIAMATMGIEGAMLQMLAHGLIIGALFLACGILSARGHSRLIIDYQGLANHMPKFAGLFLLFALANIGLPGTIGFVSEIFILLSALQINFYYALAASLLLIFSVVYMLWTYKQIMFGPSNANANSLLVSDIAWNEKIGLMILAVIIGVFGIWPKPLLVVFKTTIQQLVMKILL